jgi:hypothetical protein
VAFASIHGDELSLLAVAEGQEAASPLVLFTPTELPPGTAGPAVTLLLLQESSLPLIATLLQADIDLNSSGAKSESLEEAGTAVSLGQGPLGNKAEASDTEEEEDLSGESDPPPRAAIDRSTWKRAMIGLDEAFEEFRRATRPNQPANNQPDPTDENDKSDPEAVNDPFDTVDAAIDSLVETSHASPPLAEFALEPPRQTTKQQFEPVYLTWCAAWFIARQLPQLDPSRGIPRGRRTGPRRRAWPDRFRL